MRSGLFVPASNDKVWKFVNEHKMPGWLAGGRSVGADYK
jgi:hypothetical protein